MKARSMQEIRTVAGVHAELPGRAKMSRRERLERWAAALERAARPRTLRPLERMEFMPARERQQLRADGSPLAVAFADPALRADGLMSDRLGDGMTFFGLSNGQAHLILCDCHYGAAMRASEVARRLRSVAAAPSVTTSRVTFALWVATLGAMPLVAFTLSAL